MVLPGLVLIDNAEPAGLFQTQTLNQWIGLSCTSRIILDWRAACALGLELAALRFDTHEYTARWNASWSIPSLDIALNLCQTNWKNIKKRPRKFMSNIPKWLQSTNGDMVIFLFSSCLVPFLGKTGDVEKDMMLFWSDEVRPELGIILTRKNRK